MRILLGAGRLRVAGTGVTGAVGVAERGVGLAGQICSQLATVAFFAVGTVHLAQDLIPAQRVADEVERMRMVGGDDDQRVRRRGLHGNAYGIGQRHRFIERAVGVAGVVGVIDTTAFDHQHEAIGVARQRLDRGAGHLGHAGLALRGAVAVVIELHVVRFEQAQQRRRAGRGL